MVTLNDIMTREVFTAEPGTPVAEVAARMLRSRVGSAVVTQGPMLLGIFTERDVLRAAASGSDLTSSSVSEWMTPDPVTVDPGTDADDAAEMMLSHGFRHLPVIEDGALAGIVSLRDILSIRIARPR
ncbi:MAG TPA: CBS domain-containing protein [Actinomycetota bacterium]|nr:CBS domain-containing protein [Actinomycetota bacterium]